MLLFHNSPLVMDVDNVKTTINYLGLARLVLKLSTKEALERLVEQVSNRKQR